MSDMARNSAEQPEYSTGSAQHGGPKPHPNEPLLDDAAANAKSSGRIPEHPRIVERLGWWLVITNTCAIILLAAAISVLSFLWFGGEMNTHWRRIMVDGWVTQIVTLSTLAIRLAVSCQAGAAVAMLASVSLESTRHGVLLKDAAAFSIARYVNNGPLTSMLPFWSGIQWSNMSIFLCILLLALTTLVSQFTSTLLLWDVRPGVVTGFPRTIQTAVGISMERYLDGLYENIKRSQNYWQASPPTYPAFAEWSQEPSSLPESVTDTGPSIRAFLPMSSETDRSALTEFDGVATAFDSRVVCVRPIIKNPIFDWTAPPVVLNATLFPSDTTGYLADVLRHNISDSGYNFSIPVQNLMEASAMDPMFIVASLPSKSGGLINSLDPMQNKTLEYSFLNSDWRVKNNETGHQWMVKLGHTFLLIGTSNTFNYEPFDLNTYSVDKKGEFTVRERGVWLDYTRNFTSERPNGIMSITLCHDAEYRSEISNSIKHVQEFPVSATRQSNYSEPKPEWNAARRTFDTTAIREHFSYPNRDPSIFALDPTPLKAKISELQSQWSPDQSFATSIGISEDLVLWYKPSTYQPSNSSRAVVKTDPASASETSDFLTAATWKALRAASGSANDTAEVYATCANCSESKWQFVGVASAPRNELRATDLSPVFNALFKDTVLQGSGGDPARAWQALLTCVKRAAYYDWLQTFDAEESATVVAMVPCQKPVRVRGFAIAMANLVVHLVFAGVAGAWFSGATRWSLLGNAWQAVAQLKARETKVYLDEATMRDDVAVAREMGSSGVRRRFNVRQDAGGERVCLS